MTNSALLSDDEADARLIELVAPPAWTNPTPTGRYHLVVVGAGTAGLMTAAGAATLGAKVALIERDRMGGDRLNVGCVPSKALVSAARAADAVRRAEQFGIRTAPPEPDFAAIMQRLRRLQSDMARGDSAARYAKLGVDVFLGAGKFSGQDTIDVAGKTLKFKRAVIATGARATRPDIPGLAEVGYLTNETLFSLPALPRRLAVIGGGPVGCEMAQAFARLGSQVTLIERTDQILGREDEDAARVVQAALERDGVRVLLETAVNQVHFGQSSAERTLELVHPETAVVKLSVNVDEILVGAGRTPNVEGLNLPAVDVAFDARRGVIVNDHLRTSNPHIYAAGDVCSPFKFTHAADFMARIALQNSLFSGRGKVSALTIPWCTYTSPEVAQVGLTEQTAYDHGVAIQTFMQPLKDVDRAILDGTTEGFVKIHVQVGTDKIVGATIVAEHAGEMIGEIVLAMSNHIGLKRLASTIHPYPTVAEAIRKCGDSYNKARLTPLVKSLFAKWLTWMR